MNSKSSLTENARSLRKNMTKEERHLWYDFLRNLAIMVHRQKVIGSYIVDFYIAQGDIIIELDGSQHYLSPGLEADRRRDSCLRSQGYTVLRYSNADVNTRFEEVCQDILNHLAERKPSPAGEGGTAKP